MAKEEKEKKVKEVKETKEVEVKEEHKCACGKDCKCKKGRVGRVFFVVGLVIVLCAVFFAVGMVSGAKFIYDDDMVEEVDKEDKEDVIDNIDTEDVVDTSDFKKIEQTIEDLEKIEQVSRNINTVEDFTNQELLLFAVDRLGYSSVHTLVDVNEVIQTYFGKNVEPEDINCHFSSDEAPLFIYDDNKKEFIPNEEHGAHGLGSYYSDILNRIVNIDVAGNRYTVEVKKAFGRSQDTGPVTLFYKTYKDMAELRNPLIDFKWENFEDLENFIPLLLFIFLRLEHLV